MTIHRHAIARLVPGLVLAAWLAIAGPLGGCTTNPATGERQLNLLSRQDEIALGEAAKPELISQFGGAITDAQLQLYLEDIGFALIDEVEADYRELPWEFTLLDDDIVNAFALPGGKVFITRGLAEAFNNEAQLASVVGHEIGHVTARHINDAMVRQMGVGVISGLVGLAASQLAGDDAGAQAAAGLGAGVGTQLVAIGALHFDREQEVEADALGIRYMARAGYNPVGSLGAMQILADLAGGRQNFIERFTSTHPDPVRRVEIIEQRLEAEYPAALASPNSNVFAERYRQQFLRPLGRLSGTPGVARRGVLPHASWCAVCATPVASASP